MLEGEKLLMEAVIQSAIDDLENGDSEISGEAAEWLESDAMTCYSFLSLCEALEINPETIRNVLVKRGML